MHNHSRWRLERQPGPVLALAIHDGHALREEVDQIMALSEADRLREEDPGTGAWTCVGDSRLVVHTSRFQVDLNRPRTGAVYLEPHDAWGLEVWREPPAPALVERSLAEYDEFYSLLAQVVDEEVDRWGRLVVLDLHSYNHRRAGAEGPPADPVGNPDVNLGTGSMDRPFWSFLVDPFLDRLQQVQIAGRPLDVRENVKFQGGYLARWLHQRYPRQVCVLSVEVKKIFMDEWTGVLDAQRADDIRQALEAAVGRVRPALTAR